MLSPNNYAQFKTKQKGNLAAVLRTMRAHRLLVSSFMLALVAALLAYPVIATQDIQPVSGRQQTLAIVVEFSDVKHTEDKASIDALIFGQVSGYYADVSYGKIQIVGKTVGWYTLPHNMSYYGEDIDPTYLGSDQVATFDVKQSFSDWVYPVFGIVVLVALTVSYAKIRRRHKYELSTVP